MQCAMAHPRPITGHVASKDLSLPALNLSRFPSSHKDPLFFFRQNNTVVSQFYFVELLGLGKKMLVRFVPAPSR